MFDSLISKSPLVVYALAIFIAIHLLLESSFVQSSQGKVQASQVKAVGRRALVLPTDLPEILRVGLVRQILRQRPRKEVYRCLALLHAATTRAGLQPPPSKAAAVTSTTCSQ